MKFAIIATISNATISPIQTFRYLYLSDASKGFPLLPKGLNAKRHTLQRRKHNGSFAFEALSTLIVTVAVPMANVVHIVQAISVLACIPPA